MAVEVKPSSYLEHLPEVFRAPAFLGRFLKIFEALLSGRADAPPMDNSKKKITGLEEILDEYPRALDPALAPVAVSPERSRVDSEFLSYLASWLALTLDQNWTLGQRRHWVARIASLYQRRGTRAALDEYLAMFVGNQVRVEEPRGFVLGGPSGAGSASTLGVDTSLGASPYFFRVVINYGFPKEIAEPAGLAAEPFDIDTWRKIIKGTRAIVDLEKPAHTYYSLEPRTPGIILATVVDGKLKKGQATLGTDTLIWRKSKPI
jgi:phage tail-like protein